MKNLNVYVVKFSNSISKELEEKLDSLMYDLVKENFSKEEQKSLILDEDNQTIVAFLSESDEYKLNRIVDSVNLLDNNIIIKYENVSNKFLYKNDFSDYETESELINDFMKSNLSSDDVLDKISDIGFSNLRDFDLHVLESV